MLTSTLLIASLGCVGAFWLSIVPSAKQNSEVVKKKRVHVTLDGFGNFDPKKFLVLSMDVDGSVRDLIGHEIVEEGFESLLHDGNPRNPCLLQLSIRHEEKTSVATLSNVLAKLKAASDPQRETVIYLYLDEGIRP